MEATETCIKPLLCQAEALLSNETLLIGALQLSQQVFGLLEDLGVFIVTITSVKERREKMVVMVVE